MDKPTISPVIPRIGQQIRLSLTFAKSLTDLQVFIPLKGVQQRATLSLIFISSLPSNPTTALNPHLPTPAISNWDQSEMLVLSFALLNGFVPTDNHNKVDYNK
jgi:hypothetical protein